MIPSLNIDRLREQLSDSRVADVGYPDLHHHILTLAERERLFVVDRPIDKDSEMHPLVRWQFRGGLPEPRRCAFLFTQPTDAKGRSYDGSVLIGGLAANRQIYSIGMGVPIEKIGETWVRALANPIPPIVVDEAVCQDVVCLGDALSVDGGGLARIPVPISTPGWDCAPFFAAGHFITRDPDSGVQNVGNYRGQVKSQRRIGMNPSVEQRAGIYVHWLKYKKLGQKMPVALVVGCPPAISFTAVAKVPEDVDEITVAGALAGAPIRVVRAKTVDLMVPAESEYVIEGYIDTEYLEPEGPVGESHGYMNLQEYNAFMEVTAITRRRAPVFTSFISQVTPSESSTIRRVAMEPVFLDHLRQTLGIRGVKRVSMHEPLTSVYALIAIQFERGVPETEVWRALYGASALHRFAGKWVIAINEDIDPDNADALFWAVCYRAQAQHDLKVLDRKDPGHGPRGPRDGGESASVLINATLRGNYPPIALPKRDFMERARVIWGELGLPEFEPAAPWYGYSLGNWPERLDAQAAMAVAGNCFMVGEIAKQQRRSDVEMNQPVDDT